MLFNSLIFFSITIFIEKVKKRILRSGIHKKCFELYFVLCFSNNFLECFFLFFCLLSVPDR